jgi:hypothetical protein
MTVILRGFRGCDGSIRCWKPENRLSNCDGSKWFWLEQPLAGGNDLRQRLTNSLQILLTPVQMR